MSKRFRDNFKNVYVLDFEFANIGGAMFPTSLAVKNLNKPEEPTKFTWLRNKDGSIKKDIWNPFKEEGHNTLWSSEDNPWDDENLYVVYFGEAEWSCFYELEWQIPKNIIDLYVEYKIARNGLSDSFSLESVAREEQLESNYKEGDKSDLRVRLGEDKVSWEEQEEVARYNIEDVEVTANLYDLLEPAFDNSGTGPLKRGQTTAIAAKIGRRGYPIDTQSWYKFKEKFDAVIEKILSKAHEKTGCFPDKKDGRKFDHAAFVSLVSKLGIDNWPTTETSGALMIDQASLRRFERYPEIKLLKEALFLKNSTKLKDMPVDRKDSRSKTYASYYGTKTGRATPSTSRHLPNMPPCFTPFMVPRYDKPIIKVDYEQQEFAIAAVLSGDDAMIKCYESGDPYLQLGKDAGVIPDFADKHHPKRAMYKTVSFMTLYGASTKSMAMDMNEPIEVAEMAMADHQRIFNKFWSWQEEYMDSFTFNCQAKVPNDDWRYQIKEGTTFRKWGEQKGYSVNTIRNWIIQATGAAILYEAVRLVDAAGYRIIGTMHDEIIVEGNSNDVVDTGRASMEAIKELMADAAENIIGYRIRAEGTTHGSWSRMKPKEDADYELFEFISREVGIDVGCPSIEEERSKYDA